MMISPLHRMAWLFPACVVALVFLSALATPIEGGDICTSFAGGGFKSHGGFTGLISGLMSRVQNQSHQKPTGGVEKLEILLGKSDVFGSNSGGSWFFSHLAFSQRFVDMLDDIASGKPGWESAYAKAFILPLRERMSSQAQVPVKIPDWFDLLLQTLAPDAPDFVAIFELLLASPDNDDLWGNLVENILDCVGDVQSRNTAISSPTTGWLTVNHTWIAMGALETPVSDGEGLLMALDQECHSDRILDENAHHSITVKVQDAWASELVKAVPIGFSARLGPKSTGGEKVFEFGHKTLDVNYQMRKHSSLGIVGQNTSEIVRRVDLRGINTADTPLLKAAAVSSAVIAGYVNNYAALPLSGPEKLLLKSVYHKLLNAVPYFSRAAGSSVTAESFALAESLRSPDQKSSCQDWLTDVAGKQENEGTLILADGGGVDNTGGVQALQNPDVDTLNLIMGYTPSQEPEPLSADFLHLFSEYKVNTSAFSKTYLPVFNMTADQAVQLYKSMDASGQVGTIAPAKQAKFFRGVRFFTFNTHTVDQPAYNIKKGRPVTINAIFVDAQIKMWSYNMLDFNEFALEIAEPIMAADKDNLQGLFDMLGAGEVSEPFAPPAPEPTPKPSFGARSFYPSILVALVSLFVLCFK